MAYLENNFEAWPGFMFNPLVWCMKLYHLLYAIAWAANSRATEYAADQHTVRLVGAENAAATLVLLEVPGMFPWAQLTSIAKQCISLGIPATDIFSEQISRAQSMSPQDWKDGFLKALKHETQLFDSHPALRDRIERVGVKQRLALSTAMEIFESGPPAAKLLENWKLIEELLSERIVTEYRQIYQAKMDMAQILLGRRL